MTQFCVAQEEPGVEGFQFTVVVSDPVESCVQPEDCVVVGFYFLKEEASLI